MPKDAAEVLGAVHLYLRAILIARIHPRPSRQKAIIRGSLHPSPIFHRHTRLHPVHHALHLLAPQTARGVLLPGRIAQLLAFHSNPLQPLPLPAGNLPLPLRKGPAHAIPRRQRTSPIEAGRATHRALHVDCLLRLEHRRRRPLQLNRIHPLDDPIQSRQPLQSLEPPLHSYISIAFIRATVSAIVTRSVLPCSINSRSTGIALIARSNSSSVPALYAPIRIRSSDRA